MVEGIYDIMILDEANVPVKLGLITEQDLLDFIADKPPGLELVLTGRYATSGIIAAADLVTEMVPLKHYFDKGVMARDGIEK